MIGRSARRVSQSASCLRFIGVVVMEVSAVGPVVAVSTDYKIYCVPDIWLLPSGTELLTHVSGS